MKVPCYRMRRSQFNRFPTVVMITNGYKYAVIAENKRLLHLSQLAAPGLTVLSISRHGTTTEENAKIMNRVRES